jgi:hypothetical protein
MDPAELVRMLLVFMLMVIALGLASLTYRRGMAFKERKLELEASGMSERAEFYAAKAEALEQRVRVLERLATDRGQDLAIEIEDLRKERVG